MLSVEFSRKAYKFLEKAEPTLTDRLMKAIEGLRNEPFPHGMKRVEDEWYEGEKVFRIRIGDYRVLYSANYEKNRIIIVNIDKRPRAY